MTRRDDFAMLDFYAMILALCGWIVVALGLGTLVFMLTTGGFTALPMAVPPVAAGISLLAAAKLLRCVLAIHRDTRALLARVEAAQPGTA